MPVLSEKNKWKETNKKSYRLFFLYDGFKKKEEKQQTERTKKKKTYLLFFLLWWCFLNTITFSVFDCSCTSAKIFALVNKGVPTTVWSLWKKKN